jgi:DNA-binding beta-propeller fold protein YncE
MKKFSQIIFLVTVLFLASLQGSSQSNVVLVRKWGEFGNKPGQLKFPAMIAKDQASNVYVVDQHNHRIQKFDSDGNFILMWGKLGTAAGDFNYPYGIAIDSKGNVFVSDMNNNRIQKFLPNGEYVSSVGSYGTGDGQLKYPYGIAIDGKDVLYVIDAFNYRVQKFTTDLQFIEKWGSAESIGIKLYMPHEIAITKEGNVIMSDRQNHRIAVFTPEGNLLKRFGDYGEGIDAKGAQFSEPHGIAINADGEMFISDRYNFRIQKFDSKGNYQLQWLASGIFDDSKSFPLGIVTGKDNNIYVTDHYAHCILQYKIIQ